MFDRKAMSDERWEVQLSFGDETQKRFHVAGLSPTHMADGIIASFLLIGSVVAPGPIRTGDAEVEFFLVIEFALNIHAHGSHRDDDCTITGNISREIDRVAAGSFRSDQDCIDAGSACSLKT